MSLEAYLKLVDWTGRQIRRDKRGKIPDDCLPILERLECSPEVWLDYVRNFHLRFRREAGLASSRLSYRHRQRSKATSQQAG